MLSKILSGSTYSLIGVVLISLATFFGFRSLFIEVNNDIASEAVMAAFAALFVILPTSFLMERESASRLKGEKRSTVFRSNLEDYRKAAIEMAGVLKDKTITSEELSLLRQNHALLVILGSKKAITASREFITKCQEIMEDSEESDIDGVRLTPENERDLWDIAMEFLGAARDGLDLGEDQFDLQTEKEAFRGLNEKQSDIEKKFPPRQELADGLDGWAGVRKLNTEQKNAIKLFIGNLITNNPGLMPKYTKTLISIRDTLHPKEKVIFYIGSIDKKKNIKGAFAATKELAFVESMAGDLNTFAPKIAERIDGFGLEVTIPFQNMDTDQFKEIHSAINRYGELWR